MNRITLLLLLIVATLQLSAQYTTDGIYTLECVGTTNFHAVGPYYMAVNTSQPTSDILMSSTEDDNSKFYIVENAANPGKFNIITLNQQYLAATDGAAVGAKGVLIENTEANRNGEYALITLSNQGANPYYIETYVDGGVTLNRWNGQRSTKTDVGMGIAETDLYEWNLTRVGDMPEPPMVITDGLYTMQNVGASIALSKDMYFAYASTSDVKLTDVIDDKIEFYIVENTANPGKYNVISKDEQYVAYSEVFKNKASLFANTEANRNNDSALVDFVNQGGSNFALDTYVNIASVITLKRWHGARTTNTDVGVGSTRTDSKDIFTLTRIGDMPVYGPTNLALSANTLPEESAIGTLVGVLSAEGGTGALTYSMAVGDGTNDADNAKFEIANGNELVAAITGEDFETVGAQTYNVFVKVTDEDAYSITEAFVITLTDVVEANNIPTDIALSSATVDENVALNTVVGTLSTTDDDAGDSHTYSFVSGTGDTDNDLFLFNGAELLVNTDMDYEVKATYSVRIETNDGNTGTFAKAFEITVVNVNEAPTAINLSSNTVDENVTANALVATLSAEDEDDAETFTFSLVAGDGTNDADNAAFTITGTDLIINESPNVATQESYNINIKVADAGVLEYTEAFTITVNPATYANHPYYRADLATPTQLAFQIPTNKNEGDLSGVSRADYVIHGAWFDQATLGDVASVEADTAAKTIISLDVADWTIDPAEDSNRVVQETGTITNTGIGWHLGDDITSDSFEKMGQTLYYTIECNEDGDYFFYVRRRAAPQAVIFELDIYDPADMITALYSLSMNDGLDKSSPEHLDKNGLSDTHAEGLISTDGSSTYIAKASGSTNNAASIWVRMNTEFALEADKTYVLKVRHVKKFNTNVGGFAVLKDAPSASITNPVGSNIAADSTYTLTASADTNFGAAAVSGVEFFSGATSLGTGVYNVTSGQWELAWTPTVEGDYTITAKATDADGKVGTSEMYTITVNDIVETGNSAPTDITLSTTTVDENTASGATVGTLVAIDADTDDTHDFSLVAGDGTNDADNVSFTVDGDKLVLAVSPDFETKASYKVNIKATDAGALVFTKAFEVTVTDVNEAPTGIELSATAIDENNAEGAIVGMLSATDVDAGDTFTYTLVAGDGTNDADNAEFTIDGDDLKINASADFETKASYKINISVADAAGLEFVKAFEITINLLNENSIANNELANLSFYPNPVYDALTIKGIENDAKITIYSISGRLVKTTNLYKGENKIDFSELSEGIYILEVRTENNQVLRTKITK